MVLTHRQHVAEKHGVRSGTVEFLDDSSFVLRCVRMAWEELLGGGDTLPAEHVIEEASFRKADHPPVLRDHARATSQGQTRRGGNRIASARPVGPRRGGRGPTRLLRTA